MESHRVTFNKLRVDVGTIKECDTWYDAMAELLGHSNYTQSTSRALDMSKNRLRYAKYMRCLFAIRADEDFVERLISIAESTLREHTPFRAGGMDPPKRQVRVQRNDDTPPRDRYYSRGNSGASR